MASITKRNARIRRAQVPRETVAADIRHRLWLTRTPQGITAILTDSKLKKLGSELTDFRERAPDADADVAELKPDRNRW